MSTLPTSRTICDPTDEEMRMAELRREAFLEDGGGRDFQMGRIVRGMTVLFIPLERTNSKPLARTSGVFRSLNDTNLLQRCIRHSTEDSSSHRLRPS
jgi:hypothetical protein